MQRPEERFYFSLRVMEMMWCRTDRVGGGLTAPTSHTTQHAGPHWAVQCRDITSRGYLPTLPATSFLVLLRIDGSDTRIYPVRRLWLSFFGANIRILPPLALPSIQGYHLIMETVPSPPKKTIRPIRQGLIPEWERRHPVR